MESCEFQGECPDAGRLRDCKDFVTRPRDRFSETTSRGDDGDVQVRLPQYMGKSRTTYDLYCHLMRGGDERRDTRDANSSAPTRRPASSFCL